MDTERFLELKAELSEKEKELADKQTELDNFEIDPDDYEDNYRDMLGEISGPIKIGGCEYYAPDVLKEIDPTAYGCGLNDYVDGMELKEDPAYITLYDEVEDLEAEVSAIKEEIDGTKAD